jgi:transposase
MLWAGRLAMSKKRDYEPEPEIPERLRERYATMLAVIQGSVSVSEAARKLNLSRPRFQTLLHRCLKGMLDGLTPRERGRPAKPQREAQLERENEKLQREVARLRERGEMIDKLLVVAAGVNLGRTRAPRTRATAATKGQTNEPEEPDGEGLAMKRRTAEKIEATGASQHLAAKVLGTSIATVRRWRRARGLRPRARAHGRALSAELHAELAQLIRVGHGLLGADALSHAVPGVSRRQAAVVKHEVLTEIERERKAAAVRVEVTAPGVMRGFDAMHLQTTAGRRFALIASDAAVPYRTTAADTLAYSAAAVASTLEQDFSEHGAPLVMRYDRAKSQTAPEVLDVLASWQVLMLQGPPHHPGYYGQLERQNREHRAWLRSAGTLDACDLDRLMDEMLLALNAAWPRRSLGWQTSEEAWLARPAINEDRSALRAEVQDRAARIRRQADGRGATVAMAERLAIERALQTRGYLRLERGGWC